MSRVRYTMPPGLGIIRNLERVKFPADVSSSLSSPYLSPFAVAASFHRFFSVGVECATNDNDNNNNNKDYVGGGGNEGDNELKPNRSSDVDGFTSLEEIEHVLSLPSKVVHPSKKRDALITEFEFFKFAGRNVPSEMTVSMWEQAAFKKTVQGRLNLYNLFALREQYKEEREREKREKAAMKIIHLQETLRDKFGNEHSLPLFEIC